MKKFVFSMEKILELREYEKKQAEIELGKANAEVARIQKSLDEIAMQKALTIKNSAGETDIMNLSQIQNYKYFLDQKKEQLFEEMAQAKLIADQKREVVLEAMKKVNVLEKLKDTKFKQWQKEYEKEQESISDDISSSRQSRIQNQ